MNQRPVYSSQHGSLCPDCGKAKGVCICHLRGALPKAAPKGDGIVRVASSTKGRKGKGVTVITGVPLDASGIEALGKELRSRCGVGGTVKDGVIELQGDHRDRLLVELAERGWKVKRAGG